MFLFGWFIYQKRFDSNTKERLRYSEKLDLLKWLLSSRMCVSAGSRLSCNYCKNISTVKFHGKGTNNTVAINSRPTYLASEDVLKSELHGITVLIIMVIIDSLKKKTKTHLKNKCWRINSSYLSDFKILWLLLLTYTDLATKTSFLASFSTISFVNFVLLFAQIWAAQFERFLYTLTMRNWHWFVLLAHRVY